MLRMTIFVCLSTLCVSCGPGLRGVGGRGGGGGGGGAGFGAQCRGDFGASAAANQFEAFMAATYEFHDAAISTQNTLLDACRNMGRELGLDPGDLDGEGPERTRAICNMVTERARSEMQAIRAASRTTVELRTQPPRCRASFDAYAECAASCDASVQPGSLEIQCEGGEIRGGCSGSCSGNCAVEVEASCTGRCEGACEGTCSARAEDGSCAGNCSGTCRGRCVASASGQCRGECRGSCSVEWQEPYCTTDYTPPQVSAECRAACDARVEARMECQPGRAELVVTGGPDAETQARAERLRAAVAIGLATVMSVRERVQRLQDSGRAVVARLNAMPAAIQSVGVSAAACSAGALANLQESLAAVTVSVEVSVSVSGSFSAG